jgi:hypothetical protein
MRTSSWRKDALTYELAETVWHERLVLAAVIGYAAFFTAETWVPNIAGFVERFCAGSDPSR